MIKQFSGIGQSELKQLQEERRNRVCKNYRVDEGMGFSLKKSLKKIKIKVKVPKIVKSIAKVAVAPITAVKKSVDVGLKVVNKVSAIPVLGTALRAGGAIVTGGASEAAIQAANLGTKAYSGKLQIKDLTKSAVSYGASFVPAGSTAANVISTAQTAQKTIKTVKAVAKGGVKGLAKSALSSATGGKSDTVLAAASTAKKAVATAKSLTSSAKKKVAAVTKKSTSILDMFMPSASASEGEQASSDVVSSEEPVASEENTTEEMTVSSGAKLAGSKTPLFIAIGSGLLIASYLILKKGKR